MPDRAPIVMTLIAAPTPTLRSPRTPLMKWWGWIVLSGLLIGSAMAADDPVARWLSLRGHPQWYLFARRISLIGEWWILAMAGGLYGAFCFFRRQPERMRAVLLVTLTGLSTGLCATMLRFLFGRTRPIANVPQGFYGIWHNSHWIIGQYKFSSFPSGHAATVVGFAAALWQLDRRAGVLAALFAALVAWSRIVLGRHHFSDIVAGALLGMGGARLAMARLGTLVDWAAGRLRKP